MHQHRFGYLMCAVSCNIILLRDFICAYIYMVTSNVKPLATKSDASTLTVTLSSVTQGSFPVMVVDLAPLPIIVDDDLLPAEHLLLVYTREQTTFFKECARAK
jgi:hypothetical protein